MVFFRKLFGYKLIFYCVDFNKKRFANRFIQFLYEKADYLCSVFSDQVWVVSEVLKEYKKEHYGIDSIYIPNSSIFNRSFYEKGKKYKRGNKIAWTGSFNTNRQIDMLFGVLSKIKTIKPDSEFYLAPINNLTKIKNYIHKHKLIDYKVISVKSRRQWQIKAARYDIGIAVYDHSFGSTQFIEPIKTWDYLLCGMPFIISNKVSICREIKKNNIVYFLDDDNKISNSKSLKQFLNHNYIKKLIPKCVEIARRYDCEKMIIRSITKLN
jgi:glycosyltransferase involved in cell wall biosynthesis